MSWMSGWTRQVDSYHLELGYGTREDDDDLVNDAGTGHGATLDFAEEARKLRTPPVSVERDCKYHVKLDWNSGEDEDQVALRLQSQVMATLPPPYDHVQVAITAGSSDETAANATDAEVDRVEGGPSRKTAATWKVMGQMQAFLQGRMGAK